MFVAKDKASSIVSLFFFLGKKAKTTRIQLALQANNLVRSISDTTDSRQRNHFQRARNYFLAFSLSLVHSLDIFGSTYQYPE